MSGGCRLSFPSVREERMPKYILLMNWTEQGIKAIKDSPKRLDNAREAATKEGVTLGDFYMTIGGYDNVLHVEAPDDATLAKFVLRVSSQGFVRTTTLKAFPEVEYRKVIASV